MFLKLTDVYRLKKLTDQSRIMQKLKTSPVFFNGLINHLEGTGLLFKYITHMYTHCDSDSTSAQRTLKEDAVAPGRGIAFRPTARFLAAPFGSHHSQPHGCIL